MISVCMGVKNGGQFIGEQIDSILPQIGVSDELVISDDNSTDDSVRRVESYRDARVRLITNPQTGLISNFENCLNASRGDFIFLSDQDDVWAPDKICFTLPHLRQFALVVSDCRIANCRLEVESESFYKLNNSRKGIIRNLIRNSYMGCCMAFHRKILARVLPFPAGIPMHDLWIGLIAEMYFNVAFIPDKLVYHRRHSENASSTSQKSSISTFDKVSYRLQIAKSLIRL
jgi:glycosyltransferase involved in cell wall biosynthesis